MVGVSSREGNGSQKRHCSSISSDDGRKLVDKSRSAILTDLDILDCPICYHALKIPVFQCENGHLACSSCCPKLRNKCPACALPVGHIRCRAMERVLESVLVPCRYADLGCTKTIYYGRESTHEKICNFSSCSCPVQGCNYTGSYKDLYEHYDLTHSTGSTAYRFNGVYYIAAMMFISDKILIERVYEKKLLFVVQCFEEPCGVYVSVSCIAPSAPEVGEFSYGLLYTTWEGVTMTYQSPKVKKVLKVCSQRPKDSFMLIPHSLLCGLLLGMMLCINELKQM
ncbi:Zinc finger RING-type [Arabidopsis suecica]|uniref:RING-type E3 ubiquitin transferase n=1 Tax=Arabidopsis suecica TaxID=45249 RepID=A0A8T2DFL9_ARASU|nr:Zinc finger RING-type [Arabidopsis suecica]